MRQQFERLEQALRFWEDMCYGLSVTYQIARMAGQEPRFPWLEAMTHWGEFRNYLLRFNRSHRFDASTFRGPEEEAQETLSAMCHLPELLAGWSANSRRVFHIEQDLQILLSLTSMQGLRWSDVSWPFRAFAITLEEPIVGEFGGRRTEFDAILVGQIDVMYLSEGAIRPTMKILLLDKALDKRVPFSNLDRQNIDGLMGKGMFNRARELIVKQMGDTAIHTIRFELDMLGMANERIGQTSERIRNGAILSGETNPAQNFECLETTARIIGGLCMYLTTLTPGSSHISPWRPFNSRVKNPDPRAISTGAAVCNVSAEHKLSPAELAVIRAIGGGGYAELCAHWRIGHWRRRPGAGSDPTAPKSVHVRPALVREDRLAEGELPGGSQIII